AYLFDVTTGNQLFKLTATDAAATDLFGYYSAISGNIAVVGAYLDDDAGSASGSAYLFDVTTGNQLFKLTASDAAAGDFFGISVGISGNVAIVGAWFDDDNGVDSGSAYLFDVTTGNQIFKLTATDGAANDSFGRSVAISGNIAIVGAYQDDDGGSNSGSAYLFDVTTGNQLFKLTATDAAATDLFGYSSAISGNIAIVGAYLDDDDGSSSGSAYLFDATTGNQLFKLTSNDAAAVDIFGFSVGISGNVAIVGARTDDDGGSDSGSAYLFDATSGVEISKLTASDAASSDLFGWSVGIDGSTAIVGAVSNDDAGSNSGSAYLFDASFVPPTPVRLTAFGVKRTDHTALLTWSVEDAVNHLGFNVYRGATEETRVQVSDRLFSGQSRYEFPDATAPAERTNYWLAEISRTGQTSWHGPVVLEAASFGVGVTLHAQPNPFGSSASISFALEDPGFARVSVLGIQGRQVKTLLQGMQPAGSRTLQWDGSNENGARVAPGVYFLKLETQETVRTQKIVFKP
ncbi:MAG: T9SS type A sorting domain-containing protein, partial [Candidatus Eisenbacteria bacterium]|nr:T9SS type A sorting domain-containing protein [Candidatus Eisenbacteria bacterium]